MIVASMMGSLAMTMGFTAIFLPQVRIVDGPLHMDDSTSSWYASINGLASPFGSISAGFVMDRFGRRTSIFLPLIPIIVLWSLTASAQSLTTLFICRMALGYFLTFIPVTCQIYLAECADPYLRSFTVNVGYVVLSSGMLVPFVLAAFFEWRTIAWASIVIPTIGLFTIFIVPETPVWLVRKGRIEKALKSLIWLRGNQSHATIELNQLTARLEADKLREKERNEETQNFWTICSKKAVYRPTLIVFLFIILLNVSGTYIIVLYAVDIVTALELPRLNRSVVTIAMSSIRLTVTVLFCWLFMHVPRRKIYLIAGIGSTLSTTALAIYIFANVSTAVGPEIDMCVKCILMTTYIATNTGFQITPGFMIGELLPGRVRGRVGGYLYTTFSISIFIVTKMFPSVRNCVGIDGILLVWAMGSLAATILIYFTVPETKGKTLHEIEDYFRYGGWIYRRERTAKQRKEKDMDVTVNGALLAVNI